MTQKHPYLIYITGVIIVCLLFWMALTELHAEHDSMQTMMQGNTVIAKIQPRVVDGLTEKPLEDACVVIPETGQKYYTGADGRTPVIEIPVSHIGQMASLKPDWYETTLLIYRQGYIEYALFHVHLWTDHTRQGPDILLFPLDSTGVNQPFSIVEGPPRAWLNNLIEQYRPTLQ